MLAAFNFGDSELTDYELTLPQKGKLTLLLDTDWTIFGGSTTKPAKGKALPAADKLTLNLPPFSGVLYALI